MNNIKEIRSQLKLLLSESIDLLFSELEKILLPESPLHKDFLNLKRRNIQAQKDFQRGITKINERDQVLNQISDALISIISNINNDDISESYKLKNDIDQLSNKFDKFIRASTSANEEIAGLNNSIANLIEKIDTNAFNNNRIDNGFKSDKHFEGELKFQTSVIETLTKISSSLDSISNKIEQINYAQIKINDNIFQRLVSTENKFNETLNYLKKISEHFTDSQYSQVHGDVIEAQLGGMLTELQVLNKKLSR